MVDAYINYRRRFSKIDFFLYFILFLPTRLEAISKSVMNYLNSIRFVMTVEKKLRPLS